MVKEGRVGFIDVPVEQVATTWNEITVKDRTNKKIYILTPVAEFPHICGKFTLHTKPVPQLPTAVAEGTVVPKHKAYVLDPVQAKVKLALQTLQLPQVAANPDVLN